MALGSISLASLFHRGPAGDGEILLMVPETRADVFDYIEQFHNSRSRQQLLTAKHNDLL
jgi:hypothetical protein